MNKLITATTLVLYYLITNRRKIDAGIGSKDENSDIEFHIISNDMLKELPSGVANTLAALREALEASSEDLGLEMESNDSGWKIESEDSGWKIEIRTKI